MKRCRKHCAEIDRLFPSMHMYRTVPVRRSEFEANVNSEITGKIAENPKRRKIGPMLPSTFGMNICITTNSKIAYTFAKTWKIGLRTLSNVVSIRG
mmetsp:Transcript_333/g.472  ORF Transcript_333/g.472 Transcript_333/m.472 type:complete len:96 (-) Transcript_333:255-542(-)